MFKIFKTRGLKYRDIRSIHNLRTDEVDLIREENKKKDKIR